jgi:hypothetical protein
MSRTSTATAPQTSKTVQPAASAPQQSLAQSSVPLDKIAARAYEKWVKGGCKHGNDKKDWLEAEMELKAEMARAKK